VILLIAAQMLDPPTTPLPAEMESAFNAYVECLDARTDKGPLSEKPGSGPAVFEAALAACTAVRAKSLEASDSALALNRAFVDPARRREFVEHRFASMEQMMREVFAGGMDPDKWEENVAKD
jgi:hypothetical protein